MSDQEVCQCGHPHLPGSVWCYVCEKPLAKEDSRE
jgi:hypothetical protein